MPNTLYMLMVLTYLGTLNPAYSSAWPLIIGSSDVSSLPATFHFLKNVIPAVSPYITTATLD